MRSSKNFTKNKIRSCLAQQTFESGADSVSSRSFAYLFISFPSSPLILNQSDGLASVQQIVATATGRVRYYNRREYGRDAWRITQMEFDNTVQQQVLVCLPSRLAGNPFGLVRACGYCGILCSTIVGRDEHIDYYCIILLFRVRVMEKSDKKSHNIILYDYNVFLRVWNIKKIKKNPCHAVTGCFSHACVRFVPSILSRVFTVKSPPLL